MPFTPPLAEQRLVLEHVAGLEGLADSEIFAAATPDVVEAVLAGAGAFATAVWAPLARRGDTVGAKWTRDGVVMPEGFPQAYRDYVEGGWGTIGVSEEWGGQGLPFSMQVAVLESLGAANTALGLCPILTVGAIEALRHHGSPEQQEAYLPKLATGEWTGTMNLTESQAGSDVGALRTSATPREDGRWSIKGTKIFISFGDHDMAANIVHLVLARTPGAPEGTRGISLFLVPKRRLDANGEPGEPNDVHVVSIEHKLGLHASPTCVLSFGDEGDCVGELIGSEHGGMRAMFTMMNNARLNVALQGLQVAEGSAQLAASYATQRVQSPRAGSADRSPVPIVEHPDVRRMLLRMKAQTLAARVLVYYAAGQVDRAAAGVPGAQERLELITPVAKAHATEIGCEVSSLGIQVHGGMGYVEETGAAQYYRDARIFPIYEGTNGIQAADLVGRKLGLAGGSIVTELIAEIRGDVRAASLLELLHSCARSIEHLERAEPDDRLAGSGPLLTMFAVLLCGWQVERLAQSLPNDGSHIMLRASCRFYLEQIVPEALGLRAAAIAGANLLYAFSAEDLTA